MERDTSANYKEVITNQPRRYLGTLMKLYKCLGWNTEVSKSRTTDSVYLFIKEVNTEIRIANHKRMGWPPYKSVPPKVSWRTKLWWWIGYHGLYQFNWWLKEKMGNRNMSDRELIKRLFKKG